MTKLKLGRITESKALKVTIELPAQLHEDLTAYAEVLGREQGEAINDPIKLIVPMIKRFIATDRAFSRVRRGMANQSGDRGS